MDKLVRPVSVLSSTQSYGGVLVSPCIMVAVSELLYRDGFSPYCGVPAVGIMPCILVLGSGIPCSVRVHCRSPWDPIGKNHQMYLD